MAVRQYRLLDMFTKEIVDTAKKTGADVSGPVPLPTRRTIYTVLRSPNIDKKSESSLRCEHTKGL